MNPVRKALATCLVVGAAITGVAVASSAASAAPVVPQAASAAQAPAGAVEVGRIMELPSGNTAFVPAFLPAHVFGPQGPVHFHVGQGCLVSPVNCFRWILQDGSVWQGDYGNLVGQYGYMLVWCSQATTATNNGNWVKISTPWGPLGNKGSTHPYCQSPYYGNPARSWSVRGTWQENF
jgi:hypothetical protein